MFFDSCFTPRPMLRVARFQLVVPATMRSPDSAALELGHGSRRFSITPT